MARAQPAPPPMPVRSGAGFRRNLVGVVLAVASFLAFLHWGLAPLQDWSCGSAGFACGQPAPTDHPPPPPKHPARRP